MVYLDGFSGYGGFHVGLERAGFHFHKVYYSEINKYAIANYSYNFPQSIYAGSIDTICESGIIPRLDLFTFGWPCQDNSIAGKRKGQTSGTRSGLLYEAVKIINKFKPRNFIAENVAGLLSVNEGIDIIESLRILTYLNESCPQYDIEMQLLNTRWVLPQNRERLYFVGHLRGSGSKQIFPIGENLTRVNERATNASTVRCLTAGGNSGGMHSGMTLIKSATQSGFEIANEGDSINYSVPGSKTRRGRVGKGVAQTLDTSCNQGVIAGSYRSRKDGENFRPMAGGISPTILSRAREDGEGQPCVIIGGLQRHQTPRTDGICPALTSAMGMGGGQTPIHNYDERIRRLTPTECERLQGLPDGHTQYGIFDGEVKELSDTQRYKLCGNGVTADIVEMIGKKLYKEPLI